MPEEPAWEPPPPAEPDPAEPTLQPLAPAAPDAAPAPEEPAPEPPAPPQPAPEAASPPQPTAPAAEEPSTEPSAPPSASPAPAPEEPLPEPPASPEPAPAEPPTEPPSEAPLPEPPASTVPAPEESPTEPPAAAPDESLPEPPAPPEPTPAEPPHEPHAPPPQEPPPAPPVSPEPVPAQPPPEPPATPEPTPAEPPPASPAPLPAEPPPQPPAPPAPELSGTPATGDEDRWIPIHASLSGPSPGPLAEIAGLPDGARLNQGEPTAVGTWLVATSALLAGELAILPPPGSDADFTLAISIAADGTTPSVHAELPVTITAQADAPELRAAPAAGREDQAVALHLSAMLADSDGSETLAITIRGLPEGASLSHGSALPDGAWSVPADALPDLALLPPPDFSGDIALRIEATATEAAGGSATQQLDLTVRIAPEVDGASLAAAGAGLRDRAIAIEADFADSPDASETWAPQARIAGLPPGASLTAGSIEADGSWLVDRAALAAGGIAIIPPPGSDADFTLTITARMRDGDAERDVTAEARIEVLPVAEAAALTARDATGREDGRIALDLGATIAGQEDAGLALRLLGLPAGATLSAGSRLPDGAWALTPDELPGLVITPPTDFSGTLRLQLQATTVLGETTAVTAHPFAVQVAAVTDAPTLRAWAARGAEDSPIALSATAWSTDSDGSERIVAIRIRDLPEGATLRSGGTALARERDGSVLLEPAQLGALTVTPPPNSDRDFVLHLSAIAAEADGSRAESAPVALPVTVDARADTPGWAAAPAAQVGGGRSSWLTGLLTDLLENTILAPLLVFLPGSSGERSGEAAHRSGTEDGAIPLNLAARLADADGSERLSFLVTGLPEGARLSVGSSAGAGRWSLTAAEAGQAALIPPPDFAGRIALGITAIAQEQAGGATASASIELSVSVRAAIDTRAWQASAQGREDTPIALDLRPPMADRDGSERLVGAVFVEGIPPGAVLRDATGAALPVLLGVARVPVERLEGATLQMPPGHDGAASLRVRATVEDTGGVRQDIRGSIAIDATGIADAPSLTIGAAKGAGHQSADPAAGWARLPVSASLADTDGSESLHVWVRDVPPGFALSAGVNTGDGAWLLRGADLADLRIRPPAGHGGTVALRVQAVATEREGDTAMREGVAQLTVSAPPPPPTRSETIDALPGLREAIAANGGRATELLSQPHAGTAFNMTAMGAIDANGDGRLDGWVMRVRSPAAGSLDIMASGQRAPVLDDLALPGGREHLVYLPAPAPFDRAGGASITYIAQFDDPRRAGAVNESNTKSSGGSTFSWSTTRTVPVLPEPETVAAPTVRVEAARTVEDGSVRLVIALGDAPARQGVADRSAGDGPGRDDAGRQGDEGRRGRDRRDDERDDRRGRHDDDRDDRRTKRDDDRDEKRDRHDRHDDARHDSGHRPAHQRDAQDSDDDRSRHAADAQSSSSTVVRIGGLPEGARLSAGVLDRESGEWVLRASELPGLTLTPPADGAGSFALKVRATTSGMRGAEAGSAAVLPLDIAAVADGAAITARHGAAVEDQAIALNLSVRAADADGSEAVTAILVTGLPPGAALAPAPGVLRNLDGSWSVAPEAVAGLRLVPPPNADGPLAFDLSVTTREGREGPSATTTRRISLDVQAAADAPELRVSDARGQEDGTVALDIAATLADRDGSETLSVTLHGLPAGSLLSAGVNNGDGSWTLAPAQLPDLRLTPPADWSGALGLVAQAHAVERATGTVATTRTALRVEIAAVADAPEVALRPGGHAVAGQGSAAVLADATLTDADSIALSGATVWLSGAQPGDRLVLAGQVLREVDGRQVLGDSGIVVTVEAGGIRLEGRAPLAAYERAIEALALENADASGLSAGLRGVTITLHDAAGAASTHEVPLNVQPSMLLGDGRAGTLAGTVGHDLFIGSGGAETMLGGAGADVFVIAAGGGRDQVDGGGGAWRDELRLDGLGPPDSGNWTLVVQSGGAPVRSDAAFDFAQPASGVIQFADGGQLEFSQIERVSW